MLFHCGAPLSGVGWLGVDLFFVLSGFLITTLLLQEVDAHGAISLRMFWARRFLRLMPLYLLYISAVTLLVGLGVMGEPHAHGGWTPGMFVASLWTYLHNLAPQGGIWDGQSLTRHLWSLSVEEQFYFVWPALLALVAGSRQLVVFVSAVVVAVVMANLFLFGGNPPHLLLHTRGLGLFAGCLVAILLQRAPDRLEQVGIVSRQATWMAALVAGASVVVMGLAQHRYDLAEGPLLATGVPFFALAMAVLIANLWRDPDSPLGRLLSVRPLPEIGLISYGIYVYHMAILDLVWQVLLPGIEGWNRYLKFGLRLSVFLALTWLVARASYQWLELPFLRLKGRFRPAHAADPVRRPSGAAAATPSEGRRGAAAFVPETLPSAERSTAVSPVRVRD